MPGRARDAGDGGGGGTGSGRVFHGTGIGRAGEVGFMSVSSIS